MSKSKIDLNNKPQIRDSFGAELSQGDIIMYVSATSKNKYELSCGIFFNHYDNGSGWKMRVHTRFKYPWNKQWQDMVDASYIGDDGIALGIIKVNDPAAYPDFDKIKNAISLKKSLLKSKKLKILKPVIKPLATEEYSEASAESPIDDEITDGKALDLLSSLKAPTIKE